MPSHFAELALLRAEEAIAAGFQPAEVLRHPDLIEDLPEKWHLILRHPERQTYAMVHVSARANSADTLAVSLVSYFTDGSRLDTTSGWGWMTLGRRPGTVTTNDVDGVTSFEQLLASHDESIRSAGKSLAELPASVARTSEAALDEYLRGLIDQRVLFPIETGRYRVGWRASLREAWKFTRAGGKLKSVRDSTSRNLEFMFSDRVSAESAAKLFLAHHEEETATRSKGNSVLLFLGTAVLFALSMTGVVSLRAAGEVVLVLTIHELGHIFGMWLFGYKNLKILFIPFFGALATGRRPSVPAYQEVIVSLLGPLPGMLIACAMYAIPGLMEHEVARSFAQIMFWINFSNLLPIMPLDGGQIVHTLFCGRRPLLSLAFKLTGFGLLLAGGIFAGDSILTILGGFGVFSLLAASRSSLFAGGVVKELRRERAIKTFDEEKEDIAQLLLTRLRARAEKYPLLARRQDIAKLVFEALRQRPATWAETFLCAPAYACALVGGPVLFIYSMAAWTASYTLLSQQYMKDGQVESASVLLNKAIDDGALMYMSDASRIRATDVLQEVGTIQRSRGDDRAARRAWEVGMMYTVPFVSAVPDKLVKRRAALQALVNELPPEPETDEDTGDDIDVLTAPDPAEPSSEPATSPVR